MEKVRKIKKTFGLAVLLKLAGVHPVERDGMLEFPNFTKAGEQVTRAIERYQIRLVGRV